MKNTLIRCLLLFSSGVFIVLAVFSQQLPLTKLPFGKNSAAGEEWKHDGALVRGPKAATHPDTDAKILPRATPPQDRVRA